MTDHRTPLLFSYFGTLVSFVHVPTWSELAAITTILFNIIVIVKMISRWKD